MKKTWKRLMALLCVSVMLLSGFSALAAEDNFDVSGSKKADPTELACPDRQTKVTLSLPSAEYKNKIDVVLVVDSSSSTDLGQVFVDATTSLFSNIVTKNPGVELKVGIVLYTGRGNDAINYVTNGTKSGLTVYDDSTKDYFAQALDIMPTLPGANDKERKENFRKLFGRGSGPHSGLDMADEWLANDTDVEDSHKYVVLLTDGKGYIWNDDNNVPTTIYSQYYQWGSKDTLNNDGITGASRVANGGKMSISQVAGYNKKDYSLDVLDPTNHSKIAWVADYQTLYDLTDEELTGTNAWDQKCTYAIDTTTPSGNVEKILTTNGVEIFGTKTNYAYYFKWTPDEAWEGVDYLQCNPYEVIDNGDGTYTFDTKKINPLYYQYHFDCLQKGLYKAGHLWTDMNGVYNCAVITYDSSTGGGLELVGPFKEWIRTNSKFSAMKADADQVNAMFDGIDNSIRYMVSEGTVTDVIADPFTLVGADALEGFEMTLNGEAVSGTFENGKWSFGTADDQGVYPYVVEYDDSSKTISWTINVPIENLKPVTLSYTLELPEETKTGSYDTNVSAILDYKSSDGAKDGTFTFEVPKVEYTACAEVKVEKIWDDNDNEAGKRPEKVEVVLMNGDKELMSLMLSEDNDWSGTFVHTENVHIPESILDDLSVKEVTVDGYKCEITGDAKDGFKITNTYVPPTTEAPTTEADTTPPTGDSSNVLLFAGILVLAGAAVVVLLRSARSREE